ncbi:Protein insensitive [Eumeta japonica]|uniref:Protein insensitive n=1 Tax=Eumeta variegata TaxID=151549 RepID=A0A4C1UVW4_EUMVA|nr:Protein insensitive [Eumeta japonica]
MDVWISVRQEKYAKIVPMEIYSLCLPFWAIGLPLKKVKTEPTKGYTKQKRKKQPRPALRPEPVLPRCWTPSRLLQETSERQTYDLGKKNGNDSKLFHKYVKPTEFDVSEQKIEINNENNTVTLIESSEISTIKREMEVIRDIVQKLKTLSNNLVKTLSGTRNESFHSQSPAISNYSMERVTPDMLYRDNEKCMNETNQETPVNTGLIQDRALNCIEAARESNSRGEFKTKQTKEDENQLETPSPKKHKLVKKENTLNNSSSSVGSELKEMPYGTSSLILKRPTVDALSSDITLLSVLACSTLATHSLTGKAPAFLSKPAKLCLDPKKVADIVMTVTANCHVKEGLVRSAITTKCADENKMLKLQTQKGQRQRTLETSVRSKDSQASTADPRQD